VRGLGKTVEKQMVENHHLLRNGAEELDHFMGYKTRSRGTRNILRMFLEHRL
jgi:hypothetical protein